MAGQFHTAGIAPEHGSRYQDLSFGSVEEENVVLLKQRGYICPSTKAMGEAAIARIITGQIDFKELPRFKVRVKNRALQAGHNNVSIKVIDRTLTTPKFLMETLSEDLQAVTTQLKFHPNIAMPYDYFQSNNHIYLVSEYIQGTGTPLTPYIVGKNHQEHVVRDIFYQINSAVKYAHEYGIIHRDLTPASIHVSRNGHVKIQDFGLSPKLSAVQETQLHEETKRVYMAPEVIKSRRYESKEADVYSMGVILYEMLHGKVPYTGYKNDILIKIYLRDLKFYAKISQEVRELMRQMLHPDPWKRPTAAACLHHNWTCGVRQPAMSRPRLKMGRETSNVRSKSVNPSSKFTCPDESRVCARATVSCGSEKIVLRSRIPKKSVAYAMDIDYANMCAQLQPPTQAKLEQKLINKVKYPRVVCQSLPTVDTKPLSPKKTGKPLLKPIATSFELSDNSHSPGRGSTSRGSVYMSDAMRICCIKKPLLVIPTQKGKGNKPVGDLCPDCVFGSRAASPESDQSVLVFDHGDSEFSCSGDYEAEALGLPKRPLSKGKRAAVSGTINCPCAGSSCSGALTNSSDQTFLTSASVDHLMEEEPARTHHATIDPSEDSPSPSEKSRVEVKEGDACEVLTTASYKSERGSPVPSDLGSVEPEMNTVLRTVTSQQGDTVTTEDIHLPKITTQENLLKFLSNIPVPDTVPETVPKALYKPPKTAQVEQVTKSISDSISDTVTSPFPSPAPNTIADVSTESVDTVHDVAPGTAPVTSPIPNPITIRNLHLSPTSDHCMSPSKAVCPMPNLSIGKVNPLAVPVPHYKLWSGRLQLSQKQYRAASNVPGVTGKAIPITKPESALAEPLSGAGQEQVTGSAGQLKKAFPLISISHPQWAGKPLSAHQRATPCRAAPSLPAVPPQPLSPVTGLPFGPQPPTPGSPDCLSQVSNANSAYDDEPPWLANYKDNAVRWRLYNAKCKQIIQSSSLVLQGITIKAKEGLSLSESLPELKHHPQRHITPPIPCQRTGPAGTPRTGLLKVPPAGVRDVGHEGHLGETYPYNPAEGSIKTNMALCQQIPPHNSPNHVF